MDAEIILASTGEDRDQNWLVTPRWWTLPETPVLDTVLSLIRWSSVDGHKGFSRRHGFPARPEKILTDETPGTPRALRHPDITAAMADYMRLQTVGYIVIHRGASPSAAGYCARATRLSRPGARARNSGMMRSSNTPLQALPTSRAGPLPRSDIQTRLTQRTGVEEGKGTSLTSPLVAPAAKTQSGVETAQPSP